MLVDSHCHLDYPEFQADFDGVLTRAKEAGVTHMLTISTKLSGFEQVRAVASRAENIACTVGVHPHEASPEGVFDPALILAKTDDEKVVGIGETGLDYFYEHSPREAQKRAFRAHIAAARVCGLPLIVHARDADEDMAQILEEEMRAGTFTGLLHCFSSGWDLARRALDLGIYISFSGILTFKKAEELRDIARKIPAERLLVETDAPYLAPVPHRGQRNEPSFVRYTSETLAELRGMDIETLGELTSKNFFRLFTRMKRGIPAA
jgi:TatD DNase family protein